MEGFAGFDKPDLKDAAMTENEFRTARLLKVLANPLRYKILKALLVSSRSPSELAELACRPLPAVSRALTLLNLSDLVSYRSQGYGVRYFLKHDDVACVFRSAESFVRRRDGPDCSRPGEGDRLGGSPETVAPRPASA
jgi:DNA-binding transcriptional ArsR family regulator